MGFIYPQMNIRIKIIISKFGRLKTKVNDKKEFQISKR